MQDWQTWFKNLIAKNYFFTKLTNTDEIASPIVKAIREKEIPVADYSSLLSAIESVRDAIEDKEGVEEVTIKNLADAKADLTEVVEKLTAILNKEEKDVVFPEIKFPEQKETVIDLSPVVKALGKIEKSIPKYEKQEIADYTELLSQMITLLDRKPTDLSKIESSLSDLSKTEDISILADWLKAIYEKETKELPDFKFDKNNRLLVAVDKVGGGGGGGLTQIETNKLLTLATEEKQDAIIAATGRGLNIPTFDYASQTQAATTDTWVFKTGGAGGTTIATVVITYVDATKEVISSVAQS